MKLSLKFSLSMVLLITMVLSLGGVLFLQQDFEQSLQQSEKNAVQEQQRQLLMIQMSLDEAAPTSQGEVSNILYEYGISMRNYDKKTQIALYQGELLAYSSLDFTIHEDTYMPLIQICRSTDSSAQLLTQIDGVYWLLSCSVVSYNKYEIVLITASEETMVFERREESIGWFLQIEIAAILLAVLASVVVSHMLTRPLEKLNHAAQNIAEGEITARTRIRGRDEIAVLSRNFDHMADIVENQINQLNFSITQKDDFIAAFTHEIKTPMTCIIGYADILRESDPEPATLQEAANAIYHDARRLETLSQKLLLLFALNRDESLVLQPVLLSVVFREAAAALDDPPQVQWDAPKEIAVLGDEALLVNLIQNLVQNSLHSLRENGQVTVTAAADDKAVMLAVADNGCGMTSEQLQRITEPFYMVDKSRSRRMNGSGVGLALCARIAGLHGTELRYESKPGWGTVCRLVLQRA